MTPIHIRSVRRSAVTAAALLSFRGNDRDPFMHVLLASTYEKLGQQDKAKALYQKAYDLATSHNPPAAFARPFARTKLGLTPGSPSR